MNYRYYRLPHRIHFDSGYLVRVEQITTAKLREMTEGDPAESLWSVDNRTIYIQRSIALARKRYLLAHELIHAADDFMHAVVNG